MDNIRQQFEEALGELAVPLDNTEGIEVGADQELKKLKKKLKKYVVEPTEPSLADALEKFNKMHQQLSKYYELAVKARSQMNATRDSKNHLSADLEKATEQRKMFENLHASFVKKYQEEVKIAQEYEAQGQIKRTKTIEELQARVKTIQDQYEESGKLKIDKYRENQIAKGELQRLEPHITTSEALIDAQLKKRAIEIEIEMTSLKQKIDMIENYKKLGAETKTKLEKSKVDGEKIDKRLKVLDDKDEEHKMAITKAHLVIDDYKKAMFAIREIWEKSQKEAISLRQKLPKSQDALRTQTEQEARLKKELETQKAQLEGLKNLEKTLSEQLKNL